jgi:hypothetical protein
MLVATMTSLRRCVSVTKVDGYLASLDDGDLGGQDVERIQAAVVLGSAGQWDRFVLIFRMLMVDWRDVFVAGGLAHADWPARLDSELPRLRSRG